MEVGPVTPGVALATGRAAPCSVEPGPLIPAVQAEVPRGSHVVWMWQRNWDETHFYVPGPGCLKRRS